MQNSNSKKKSVNVVSRFLMFSKDDSFKQEVFSRLNSTYQSERSNSEPRRSIFRAAKNYRFSIGDQSNNEISSHPSISSDNSMPYESKNQCNKSVLIQPPEGKVLAPSKPHKRKKYVDLSTKQIQQCCLNQAIYLDLSGLSMQYLPESIATVPQIKELLIKDNRLSTFPSSIGCLVNLKLLMAQSNLISCFPKEMISCSNLNSIDIRNNRLRGSQLPQIIAQLQNLTQLFISFNHLTGLNGVHNLTHLQTLIVKNNELSDCLTTDIGKLKFLIHLDLSHNMLVELPSEIGCCLKLTRLVLDFNKLQSLPDSIGNLSELTHLGIKYNKISTIPKTLIQCHKLTEFNIENNLISGLPEDLLCSMPNTKIVTLSRNRFTTFPSGGPKQFAYIEKLSMDHNELGTIPLGIFSCTKRLQYLNLSDNSIMTIMPKDLESWSTLHELYLGWNNLHVVPSEIGCLTRLHVLELASNNLKKLPETIALLKELRVLDLEFNQIRQLPPEIGSLCSLQTLILNSNKLTHLPKEIGKLENLRQLYLNENDLSNLPPEISNCHNLEEICLKDNDNLRGLPFRIVQLKKLRILNLDNCCLSDLAPEVDCSRADSVLLYYSKIYSNASNHLQANHRFDESALLSKSHQQQHQLDISNLSMANYKDASPLRHSTVNIDF